MDHLVFLSLGVKTLQQAIIFLQEFIRLISQAGLASLPEPGGTGSAF